MKWINLFFLILLVAIVSCKNEKCYIHINKIQHIDSIYLNIKSEEFAKPGKILVSEKSNVVLSQTYKYGKFNNRIDLYSLDKAQYLSTIGITEDYINVPLVDIVFINKDSILLLYGSLNIDSSIFLVNCENEIKSVINISEKMEDKYVDNLFIRSIDYKNGKLFFTFNSFNNFKFGEDNFNANKYPLIGCYSFHEETIKLNDFWYPNSNKFYPYEAKKIFIYPKSSNELVFSFTYTNEAYVWNISLDENRKYTIKSNIIDSISSLKTPTSEIFNYEQPSYGKIVYDNINDIYTRNLVFFNSKYSSKLSLVSVHFDNQFNYIGESINKFHFYNNSKWGFDNRIGNSIKWGKSEFQNKIKLINFDYNFVKIKNYDSLINGKIKELSTVDDILFDEKNTNQHENYYELYSLLNSNEYDKSNLIVINNFGCSSCNNYILSFLSEGSSLLNDQEISLLLIGSNDFIKYVCDKYKFSENIIILKDSNFKYNYIYKDNKNPYLFQWVDKSIVRAKQYGPQNVKDIVLNLLNDNNLDYSIIKK